MKVKLLKTICGAYKMAHFAGEVIEVTEAIGVDMIQNEFAELVENSTEETQVNSEQIEESETKRTGRKAK